MQLEPQLDQEDFVIEQYAREIDFPVGNGEAIGYYSAQDFRTNNHLGEDWNGINGGNTDLGDTIYSISNGHVKFAEDYGAGWGNVIRINHFLDQGEVYESLYAHCDEILVSENDWVEIGQPIGTIGTADGLYLAHLHFEIRTDTSMGIGPGYGGDISGYVSPKDFIDSMRVVLDGN